MPYVQRSEQGEITSLNDSPSNDNNEWLDNDHVDVLSFVRQGSQASVLKKSLDASDVEMARVLEDVIDILMEKQVFVFTELPEAVQDKLNKRKQLREDVNALTNLIAEEEDIL